MPPASGFCCHEMVDADGNPVVVTIDELGKVIAYTDMNTGADWTGPYPLSWPTCGTPPTPEGCSIVEQPTSQSGTVGDSINLGGAVANGTMQWYEGPTATGPWVAVPEPTQITQEGTVYYRFCCVENPAVCSVVVTVTGAAACQITSQPSGATGNVGDSIDLGGAVSSGSMNWQTSTSPSGPWTATSEPTTITTVGTVYYRFCCDNGTTCSNVVAVTGNPVCTITAQPTGASGTVGDPISLGGSVSSGNEQWQTSAGPSGPWTNTSEPTTITAEGTVYYRFCCVEDPTVCSNVVSVVGTALPLMCADLFTKTWPNCPPFSCSGTKFEIRPGAASQSDFDAALVAIPDGVGGNWIEFQPGEHPGYYQLRGSAHDPGPAPDGVPGNHNCISGADGAYLSGADFTTVVANLDLKGVKYWDVHDIVVTQSTGHGVRLMSSGGDAGSRVVVSNVDISGTAHARLVVQGWFSDQTVGTEYVDIFCPKLHGDNGPTDPNPWWSEGLYIGSGLGLGMDGTHDIRVYGLHAYDLTADGIDIKPGANNIEVYDAWIHDITLDSGGPVAAISINDSWAGAVLDGTVVVDGVVIYNVNYRTPGSFGNPISIGDGHVTIRHLIEWDNNANNAVRVRPITTATPGMSVTVECATAPDNPMMNVYNPDGVSMTVTEQCNIDSSDGVSFVGPTSGTADSGFGPGSGFVPVNGSAPAASCCSHDIAGCPTTVAGALAEAPA